MRSTTTYFDLVKDVRVRRSNWVGDILHIDTNRLLHNEIEAQLHMNVQGGLMMDAPSVMSLIELKESVKDKSLWTSLRTNFPSYSRRVGRYM